MKVWLGWLRFLDVSPIFSRAFLALLTFVADVLCVRVNDGK